MSRWQLSNKATLNHWPHVGADVAFWPKAEILTGAIRGEKSLTQFGRRATLAAAMPTALLLCGAVLVTIVIPASRWWRQSPSTPELRFFAI